MIDNCFCWSESWINIRCLHFNANLETILKVFFSLIPKPQLYTITHMGKYKTQLHTIIKKEERLENRISKAEKQSREKEELNDSLPTTRISRQTGYNMPVNALTMLLPKLWKKTEKRIMPNSITGILPSCVSSICLCVSVNDTETH